MGKIKQGILGPFSGKVGTVVGAIWKGIGTIRALPASMSNPRTEAQVNQRNKFNAAQKFVNQNLTFIKVGFKAYAKKMSAGNAAQSYVLNNAITGVAPDFTVDYEKALVSRGRLEGVLDGTAEEAGGMVNVEWGNNSTAGNARPDDRALLLVYNVTQEDSQSILEEEATRASGSMSTTVSANSGDILQVYLAFIAADGSHISDSTRIQELTAS